MRSSSQSLRGLLAAATIAAMGALAPGGVGVGMPGSTVVSPRATPSKRQKRFGDGALNAAFRYPNGPGWTVAQVKRMAKKKRNVAKNRRNHRG